MSEADEDMCRECGGPNDDGEGWDGLCGVCADRAEIEEGAMTMTSEMPEIEKVLVCSTGNLTREVCDGLPNIEGLWVLEYEHGHMVFVGYLPDLSAYPDLKAATDLAQKHGCRWVRFDCDAEPAPGLPVYDW